VSDWRKSSYSNGDGGECVELASGNKAILVRDTKDRNIPALAFTPEAWLRFTAGLK
jgi:Domain of unknown function (DUF397)